jgi:hypothetical protein
MIVNLLWQDSPRKALLFSGLSLVGLMSCSFLFCAVVFNVLPLNP